MKQKGFAVGLLLVVVSVSVFVVRGISQPPAPPPSIDQGQLNPPPPRTDPAPFPSTTNGSSSSVPPAKPPKQEWTFEQLVEALKGVRARQKDLKTQEGDLLAKIAEKVEQKRKDLHKAEEVLHQLRGEPSPRPAVQPSGGFANPLHP